MSAVAWFGLGFLLASLLMVLTFARVIFAKDSKDECIWCK